MPQKGHAMDVMTHVSAQNETNPCSLAQNILPQSTPLSKRDGCCRTIQRVADN
jgi:hypothetical protein